MREKKRIMMLSCCDTACLSSTCLSVHAICPVWPLRCRRPKSQQPSVVLMWDRLLLVAGICSDTIQYP